MPPVIAPPTRRGRALAVLADGLRLDPAQRGRRLAALPEDAWIAPLSLANDHQLGPALAVALAGAQPPVRAPGEAAAYLELLRGANAARNTAIRRQALELAAALNRRGATPMVLKGALSLFADAGRDPAARMMADIDILVPGDRRAPTEATLARLGYRVADRYPEGHHAVAEFTRDGDPAAVDLHLELVDPAYILPAERVLARARTTDAAGARVLLPAPSDRLLHVLLHAQVHHRGNFYRGHVRLSQLYDFAVLVARDGARIDWPAIDRRLGDHRLRPALDSYLLAAGNLFGLDWPLARAPLTAGRRHAHWSLLNLTLPPLERIVAPAGNLRAAFAWHRMRARYGDRGGPLSWHGRHLWQYVRRHDTRQALARLFR